jgi:predicted PurR-regulated permease PerM
MEIIILPAIIVLLIFGGYTVFFWIGSLILLIVELIDYKIIRPALRWVSKKFGRKG